MSEKMIFGTCIYRETGLKHLIKEKPCEDSVSKCYSKETGVTAISLSDGAGSCEHALIGSTLVAETASQILVNKFELLWQLDQETTAEYIIREVCRPLEKAVQSNGWTMDSLLATLLCVAMHPDGRYIAFHVGDGVIVGYSSKEGCCLLSQYEHVYSSNIATFVNVPRTSYKLIKGKGKYDSFLLMSDGAEPYLVPGGEITAPIMMLQQASYVLSENETIEYISSLMETLRTECHADDDLSFALLFDIRKTEQVFLDMSPVFLSGLMDIPTLPKNNSLKRRYLIIIQELHYYPDGVLYNHLCRKLYLHHKHFLVKKLKKMFPGNYVQFAQGKVYLR